MYIDTHAHSYFNQTNDSHEEALSRALEAGITHQIQISCDEVTAQAALNYSRKNENFYSTVGLHPSDALTLGSSRKYNYYGIDENFTPRAKNLDELFEFFTELYLKNKNKIVAVGECGFDRFHDNSREIFDAQILVFKKHFNFARKFNLPLILHSRNSTSEMLQFLDEQNKISPLKEMRIVMHCFADDKKIAKFLTQEYGIFLGIGGVLTYKSAEVLREVVSEISLEFLLTETDSPFLPPQIWRKKLKVNEPTSIPEIVEKIAELKNEDVLKIRENLIENGQNFFGI